MTNKQYENYDEIVVLFGILVYFAILLYWYLIYRSNYNFKNMILLLLLMFSYYSSSSN